MTTDDVISRLGAPTTTRYEIQVRTGPAELPPFDGVPEEWTQEESDVQAVWASAFTVNGVSPRDLAPTLLLDVLEARLLVGIAKFEYIDASGVRVDFGRPEPEVVGDPQPAEIPQGPRLLILLPVREDPDSRTFSRSPYIEGVEAIIGLAFACCGRSFAYRRLFDNLLRLKDGSVSAFVTGESPIWHGSPDVSDSAVQMLQSAGAAIQQLGEADQRRLTLSLRWFSQAVYSESTDAFLRLWIGLETLAMPNTTNIRPLEESLARAYGIDRAKARQRFQIGRVYDLRNMIVHDGEEPGITPALLSYLQAVFQDVLCDQLRIGGSRAADRALQARASGIFVHYGWN